MNRPSGQAKTRPKVRPPRKPYADKDDNKNAERFQAATKAVLGLSEIQADAVRRAAKT